MSAKTLALVAASQSRHAVHPSQHDIVLGCIALLLAVAGLLPMLAWGGASAEDEDAVAFAETTIDAVRREEWPVVQRYFSSAMAARTPPGSTERQWRALVGALGPVTGRDAPVAVDRHAGGAWVSIPVHFDHGDALAVIGVSLQGRIDRLSLQATRIGTPPPPADARYRERALWIASGAGPLPATLTMPVGNGPFPAAVLVPGTGQADRNGTVGLSRPMLDLARGLAAHGIATLRFDKRTRAKPSLLADPALTVDRDITDDAVLAVHALRGQPRIDAARVFVIGHSYGGSLSPRIATRAGGIAGVVAIGAPVRPLLEIFREQILRIATERDGMLDDAERASIQQFDDTIAALRQGRPLPGANAPLGMSAGYWRSTDDVHPVADALALRAPMLIVQGERDARTPATEADRWAAALSQRKDVALLRYPTLDHYGFAGIGRERLVDDAVRAEISPVLIDDVARWMSAQAYRQAYAQPPMRPATVRAR